MEKFLDKNCENILNKILGAFFQMNSIADNMAYALDCELLCPIASKQFHISYAHAFVGDTFADRISNTMVQNNLRPVRLALVENVKSYEDIDELFTENYNEIDKLRKLIYNSLTYIINHYEDTITAIKEYEEDWKRSSQWSERYLYQNLIINDGVTKVSFKTVIDHEGCYPDEEYCGVYVNRNRDTNICFFDLKKAITPILKSSMYIAMFMNMIENLYNKNINVSAENIQQILVLISNNRKEKRRILKLRKSIEF